ncbi:CAP-Gly domain-containing linker protein 4 [Aphanomyces cochlioides]|nr:CAP-Gly domain-containing linker protein 4 [Aphanomyces cochlioides]
MTKLSQEEYEAIVALVKKQRPRALTREEQLDIIMLQAHFRKSGEPGASVTVASILGRGDDKVKRVWGEFMATGTVFVAQAPANKTNHASIIPRTPYVVSSVQAFVRERRLARERTVANDVMAFFIEMGLLNVDSTCNHFVQSALRMVRRFLCHLGFKRGKKPSSGYHLSAKHAQLRDLYVLDIHHCLNDLDGPTMVYLDESFIHHHYCQLQDSLFDPNDPMDTTVRANQKGR